MTEKNKPGRKPRKVAESVNKKLTEYHRLPIERKAEA